jgi:hypothetical protein
MAIVRGKSSVLLCSYFTPCERVPGTHQAGSWIGPRADLGNMENWRAEIRKREINQGRNRRKGRILKEGTDD